MLNAALAAVLVLATAQVAQAAPTTRPQHQAKIALANSSLAAAKKGQALPDAHVLIVLSEPSAVQIYANAIAQAGGAQTSNMSSVATATRAQIAKNKAQQATLVSSMKAAGINYKEIFRIQRVMNGVAVIVPAAQVAALKKLPNVASVRTIVPSKPTSNTSATFVGANQVWQGIPSAQADGTGITIGIIDTGVDYQHSNFGGTGLLTDYQANDRVTLNGITFPTTKVVGGTDLAGDAYDAGGAGAALIPVPDPNPTDCYGHGTHVAGIAAGFGVNPDGSTFTGPYDTATVNALYIQPGIAPKALLYSIRVFGCAGSTNLTTQAIDWALDPNQDGDLSDHLNVINMSLGSDAGGLTDLDTEASNTASLSGMIVVAASGNAGDTYLVTSTPASAQRTISVAASTDGGETAGNVAVTVPASITGNYFAVPAAFGPVVPTTPLNGNFAYGTPHNGCNPAATPTTPTAIAGVSGMIAVIDRGTCTFQTKVYNAQLGGAIAAIVVDNRPEVPISMGGDATVPTPTIAAVMISQADGAKIKAQLVVPNPVSGSLSGGVPAGDLVASFSSRGPVSDFPMTLKPEITAPGVNIVSAQTGMTCVTGGGCIVPTASGLDPGNLSLTISGTSMATPQVAGLVALLRQLHPTASVEEIKALAMNGSLHDLTQFPGGTGFRYGAGRVGAGRIDAVASANLPVAAFNADGSGAVAVTFPSEIGASTSVTRKVRVKNYGSTTQNLTLAIDTVVDNPGVSFSVPGGSTLQLQGNQTIDIDVQMSGSAGQVTNNFDPTIYLSQGTFEAGVFPRWWEGEETAYLTFSTGAGTLLRLPLYVTPQGQATMSAAATSVPTGGTASGTTNIQLTGTGICTGALTPGPPPSCGGAFPVDVESLVTPFELQASNPRNQAVVASHNLRYAGVSTDGTFLNFGLAMWGKSPVIAGGASAYVPQTVAVPDVEVTIVDSGGAPLFTMLPYVTQDPNFLDPTNVYWTAVIDWVGNSEFLENVPNALTSNVVDTRIFQNDVYFMSIYMPDLVTGGFTGKIQYVVDSYDENNVVIDHLGPFTFDLGNPGLDFGGAILLDDLPGAKIPVAFNVANLTANASLGALLLHHHNAAGMTAEMLTVPPVTVLAPVLQSAASRMVQGTAGTFDLPLGP